MRRAASLMGLAFALVAGGWAGAQTPPAAAPAAAHVSAASRSVKSAAAPHAATRPAWRELSAVHQKALSPLAAQWDTLNEAQKRKWIALSANFPKMSGEEQAKLHSRMTEWVALSPQQRTTARLNYGETRKLSPGDRKAKWEAYQALPPEEKKKLAAKSTTPRTPTTAAALKPVPREKLATVPRARANPESKPPRIAAAPNQVNHNTLLPRPRAAVEPPVPQAQPAPAPPPQAGTPD